VAASIKSFRISGDEKRKLGSLVKPMDPDENWELITEPPICGYGKSESGFS
jgi:hypothetical protein